MGTMSILPVGGTSLVSAEDQTENTGNGNLYIGIDPGSASGAWVAIRDRWLIGWGVGSNGPSTLAEFIIRHAARFDRVTAAIEKVHSMPRQGVSSVFSFGENYGMYQGVLTALSVPYIMVTPQRWQKTILDFIPARRPGEKTAKEARAYKGELKSAVVDFVRRQSFGGSPDFSVKKNWGAADAICIALYAKHGGQQDD